MLKDKLKHKFLKFNQHNKSCQELENNLIVWHTLYLNCGHIMYEEMNTQERIHEYHFFRSMGRDIDSHKICLCYLHTFKYHLHIVGIHSHTSLLYFRPRINQDRFLHISEL